MSATVVETTGGLRARLERLLVPGTSGCGRCQRPWRQGRIGVREHTTMFSETRGCFPLCHGCWRALKTTARRLPYYRALWEHWQRGPGDAHCDWAELRKAVHAEVGERPPAEDPLDLPPPPPSALGPRQRLSPFAA